MRPISGILKSSYVGTAPHPPSRGLQRTMSLTSCIGTTLLVSARFTTTTAGTIASCSTMPLWYGRRRRRSLFVKKTWSLRRRGHGRATVVVARGLCCCCPETRPSRRRLFRETRTSVVSNSLLHRWTEEMPRERTLIVTRMRLYHAQGETTGVVREVEPTRKPTSCLCLCLIIIRKLDRNLTGAIL